MTFRSRGPSRSAIFCLAIGLLGVLAEPATIHGEVLVVDPASSTAHADLSSALLEARDGDVIEVRPGDYEIRETLSFLGKAIRVHAPEGPEATRLTFRVEGDATGRQSVFAFDQG